MLMRIPNVLNGMKNMEIQDYTRREILNCSGKEKEKLRET